MGASDSAPTYVEERSGGYYLRGTRVSLDSVVHQFRQGASAESILRAFPLIGSLERVYGAIAYYLAHKDDVDAYLERQRQMFEAERTAQRIPDDLTQRLERARGVAPAVVRPRFQADADLHADIVTGVLRREPTIDFQTAQERLGEAMTDTEVLALSAAEGRILASHDVNTLLDRFRAATYGSAPR